MASCLYPAHLEKNYYMIVPATPDFTTATQLFAAAAWEKGYRDGIKSN
jgi:hypothetical protein